MKIQPPLKNGASQEYFNIEIATNDHDLLKIVTVVNEAFKKAKFIKEGVERVQLSEIKNFILDPKKELHLCICPSQEICGTILLDFFQPEKVELKLFALHPSYQGQGIGPLFIKSVEQEAFKKVDSILLKVIPLTQEKLVEFYKKLGYKPTDTIAFPPEVKEAFFKPEYRDAIYLSLMEKNKLRK